MSYIYSIKGKLLLVFISAVLVFSSDDLLKIYFIKQFTFSIEKFVSTAVPMINAANELEVIGNSIALQTNRLIGAQQQKKLTDSYISIGKLLDELEIKTSAISLEGGDINVLTVNSLSQSIRSLSQIVFQVINSSFTKEDQARSVAASELEILETIRNDVLDAYTQQTATVIDTALFASIQDITICMVVSIERALYAETLQQLKKQEDEFLLCSEKLMAEVSENKSSLAHSSTIVQWLNTPSEQRNRVFEIKQRVLFLQVSAKKYLTELDQLADQLTSLTSDYRQRIFRRFQTTADAAIVQEKRAINLTVILNIIAATLLLIFYWIIVVRGFGNRLTIISQAMRSIPTSDSDTKIRVRGRDEIAAMARALERLLKEALLTHQMATIDHLTQVNNRASFFTYAEKETERSKRRPNKTCIMMIDIDHFKHINDTYGHDVGDKLLSLVADNCLKCTRTIDVFARLGGDEFTLMMPDTDLVSGRLAAERLRQRIDELQLELTPDVIIKVTTSIGISVVKLNETPIETALIQADKALYLAKTGGRNQSK
ncbi:diguanylate cyclase [Psychromonas ingrahamii 37]|uniref:diguanylate cyclase n=1 Tax=Psychromonas ingrahamii (strain DSM 17664 / CCUG 51855 / 37) TaxID=357804 RepID=A1SUH3_PSYIN|nr:sensor domain-containing diguanylate cyclase [Psychromonas ingrahamii]ABM03138.1 diguanylate cyclase [Psychromonas ingrahamii 37]